MALKVHTDGKEILWGAAEIGEAVGLTRRKTFYLLERGRLAGARKLGCRWCISRTNLMANFDEQTPQYSSTDRGGR
jgi:hypothetical protein